MTVIVGTAGWAIPGQDAGNFPSAGTVLERYATRFRGVEINSSFYRSHRPSTWARWAASVPGDFRFAVKIPRLLSHERKLAGCAEDFSRFLAEAGQLGDKLDVLLLQLPPTFVYDEAVFVDFVAMVSAAGRARLVCEPRHGSWFEDRVDQLFDRLRVARVAADPARVPAAGRPGGWRGIHYWRLHGSPRIYRSPYDEARLADVAAQIAVAPGTAWCVFDNTAAGAATGNALSLQARFGSSVVTALPP